MSDVKVLHDADNAALMSNQIISHVTGEKNGSSKQNFKRWGATGAVTVILLIAAVFLGSGFLIPVGAYERLIEATDSSRTNAIESSVVVFQQALSEGNVPKNTIMRLKNEGVLVGKVIDGEFVEAADGDSLKVGDEIISATNFQRKVHENAKLYGAFINSTYLPAAYYYDDAAKEVFRRIGTSRNNYSADESFDETTSGLMGEGSSISVNNVALVAHENDEGETEYTYEMMGETASSAGAAADFVESVRSKSLALDHNVAALNAAGILNTADATALEQKSSLFFLAFMENIAKMKAGDGNEAKVNEAMNMLYEVSKSEVVDVKTGEIVVTEGSMVGAPSLAAILSGERLDTSKVTNYSSDRILMTVENKIGQKAGAETFDGTVSSTASKIKGTIGRFLNAGNEVASFESVSSVVPTVEKSLVDNSFSTVKGEAGGELLVSGAVNVSKALALASGGTVGDAQQNREYAKLNSEILALEAEVDRMNRSPLDASSPNTFLGNLVKKLGSFAQGDKRLLSNLHNFATVARQSALSFVDNSYADDGEESYLTTFGDCETLENINAVGTATCSVIVTFDTSTLDDVLNNPEFIAFVEANTELKDGVRTVKPKSKLAQFIIYNDERMTPIGVIDGGILTAIRNENSSIPFVSNIIAMIQNFLGASEEEIRISSGAAYVNSKSNADWDEYKYAQRYVSLARALSALRQFDGDETAYQNFKFFEGKEDPVVAFTRDYYLAMK